MARPLYFPSLREVSERKDCHRRRSLLAQRVAAEELACDEEELEGRFSELAAVMPGLAAKLHTVKPRILAALAADPAAIANRLLHLRTLFPTANVEQMALRDFDLLLSRDVVEIGKAAADLREILPQDVDLDRRAFDPLYKKNLLYGSNVG